MEGVPGLCLPADLLIPRVLRKIREDQAWVVLIAPRWPRRNWFLDLIGLLAGPRGPCPFAHDTRSVSTSWALFSGVSVEEIHKAAYWRSLNSFISFYLRDIPAAEPSFSRAALAAAAQSQ